MRLLTAGAFVAFFAFGFIDNLKGPTLPAVLQELRFDYTQGGTLQLSAYLGFLVATLAAGVLADRAGARLVMVVAGACLLAGISAFSGGNSLVWLAASLAVIGLGLGSIEISANAIMVDVRAEQKGRYLNLMAACHGVGAMLAPALAGIALASGWLGWRQMYQAGLALAAVVLVYFLAVRYPRRAHITPDAGQVSSAPARPWWRSAFSARMAWYYALSTLYVAAEIGLAYWIVTFLQNAKGYPIEISALSLTAFWGAVTLGRLGSSLVVERIGYVRSMLVASIGAAACLAIGTFGPREAALLLPATGLFYSLIFPTMTAAVSDLHSENAATVLSLLFACAGLGGAVGPWLVGVASDLLGLATGFGTVLLFCLCMVGVLAVLHRWQTEPAQPAAPDIP